MSELQDYPLQAPQDDSFLEDIKRAFNQSIGAKRVRVEFNPSGDPNVYRIKKNTADLINDLQAQRNELAGYGYDMSKNEWLEKYGEELRLIEIAQQAYEDACMWAVKALTV